MPVYEFYCTPCHTLFAFYSKKVTTNARPSCPRCGSQLERRVSLCSIPERNGKKKDIDALPLSEARLSEGMHKLEREVQKLRDQDPRQAQRMLQKFTAMTGVRFNEMFDKLPARSPDDDGSAADTPAEDAPARDPRLYEL
jgi:putative FmdB family regulatory protein